MAEFININGRIIMSRKASVWAPIIALCHNNHVKHLYRYGKTARVRKKNKKRAIDLGIEWICEVNGHG